MSVELSTVSDLKEYMMKHRLRAMVLLLGVLAVVGPARPFNSGLIGTPSVLAQAAPAAVAFPSSPTPP